MAATPVTLKPKTDISSRTLLSRLGEELTGMEGRMTAAHEALGERLDKLADDVTKTREAVARIEGAREAEQRLQPPSARKSIRWAALAGGIVAVLAALGMAWRTMVEVGGAVSRALLSTAHN